MLLRDSYNNPGSDATEPSTTQKGGSIDSNNSEENLEEPSNGARVLNRDNPQENFDHEAKLKASRAIQMAKDFARKRNGNLEQDRDQPSNPKGLRANTKQAFTAGKNLVNQARNRGFDQQNSQSGLDGSGKAGPVDKAKAISKRRNSSPGLGSKNKIGSSPSLGKSSKPGSKLSSGGKGKAGSIDPEAVKNITNKLRNKDIKGAGKETLKIAGSLLGDKGMMACIDGLIPSFGLTLILMNLIIIIAFFTGVPLKLWTKLLTLALDLVLLAIIIIIVLIIFLVTILMLSLTCNKLGLSGWWGSIAFPFTGALDVFLGKGNGSTYLAICQELGKVELFQ